MPEVEFTEEQYTVDESTSHATITVTLDALTSTSDVTVEYFTSNGTAVTGSDYTSSTGILTIPIGAKTITFTIPILNDTEFDPDETIILTLTNPEGSVLGGPITSILRIVDDEKYTVFLPTVINPE
jgi:hypothetical protein